MAELDLRKPSNLTPDMFKISYPVERFDLRAEANDLLVKKGFVDSVVPLEDLHLYVSQKEQALDDQLLSGVTRAFYETSEKFRHIYFGLIQYIKAEVFKFDFIFQETPTIRFHFPGPLHDNWRTKEGLSVTHHVDSMLGHPFEEINCWLPLTMCYGSNALAISSLADGAEILTELCEEIGFDTEAYTNKARHLLKTKLSNDADFRQYVDTVCKPMEMKYGEILIFEPRCLHCTDENKEVHTRVSLDFRLIPLDTYQAMALHKSGGRTQRLFTRGDVFYQKSAMEL